MKKTLILTCNTGEGHNSAAGAIKTVFDAAGCECVIADALRFVSSFVSNAFKNWHSRIYRYAPKAFEKGYSLLETHASFIDDNSPLYYFLTSGAGKLHRFILAGGYEAVICVHPIAALIVTRLIKKRSLPVTTCFVSTDYTCSPTVPETELDMYFIPHEDLKDEFSAYGIPREKLYASGIPIRQEFYSKTDKAEAKTVLGIDADMRNVLLMCGSMGCGPIKSLTESISAELPPDVILTVLCGRNEHLRSKLVKTVRSNVSVLGFTDKVSLLMDSADLYLTKAGGLSTSEAAAKRLPMALINAISGCEAYNRRFFAERGCAVAVETYEEFPAAVCGLLSSPDRLGELSQNLEREFTTNAAEFIFKALHK